MYLKLLYSSESNLPSVGDEGQKRNHKSTEWLRLEGPLEMVQSTVLLSAESPRAGCSGPSLVGI